MLPDLKIDELAVSNAVLQFETSLVRGFEVERSCRISKTECNTPSVDANSNL
jgi:hypothetical protein